MAENEREEGGITIGEIFRVIFSQKWILLIILAAVTLAGTLGIYYGKNKIDMSYDVSFTLELPQTEIRNESSTSTSTSATVVYYPDGKPFYYTDIVSLEKLRTVKKSNDDFVNINVDEMAKAGDISISRSIYETANNSGAYESIYNLSVKASYFPNKDVASEFLVALTNTPIDYLSSMNIDYDVYMKSAEAAPDYVTEISQLIAQANYLIERYETFIELYNDLSIDGKTLRSYAQEVKSYLNDSMALEILQTEVRLNSYLKSQDVADRYKIELEKLQRQYEIASFTLEKLEAKGDSEAISAEIFKNQSDLVKELEKQMEEITGYTTKSGEKVVGFINSTDYGENKSPEHEAFLLNLNDAYGQVHAYTNKFKTVAEKLYSKVSVVSYSNSNIIVVSGVTNTIMAFIISFVVGLIVAMIVSFIVGWNKKKKAVAISAPAPEGKPEKAVTAEADTSENNSEQNNG